MPEAKKTNNVITRENRWAWPTCRLIYLTATLSVAIWLGAMTGHVLAFRVADASDVLGLGIGRWNAAPHSIDGVERSLVGGLRFSLQGGSYEAYRDLFKWEGETPSVTEFQSAVEEAFGYWTAIDPAFGFGTDVYFVPDFDTEVVPVVRDGNPLQLNPGAEIDLFAATLPGYLADAHGTGDPYADSVTLTSGVTGYPAGLWAGFDIRMTDEQPWESLDLFRYVLGATIGATIGLYSVDSYPGPGVSLYYDDNFDDTSDETALATLNNPFADLIDPFDPDNSPGLNLYEPCDDAECTSLPGFDTPGVDIFREGSTQDLVPGMKADDFAGRQFLYPFIRVPGDFNADKLLTVEDLDLLSAEARETTPRSWFDLMGDGTVDQVDRAEWVHTFQDTWFGDSNLDGEFNSGDVITVFQAGQYEDGVNKNSSWATGDWNGDAEFDTGDLVFAFQDGGFEAGPRGALNPVPEPTSIVLLLSSFLASATQRKRAV